MLGLASEVGKSRVGCEVRVGEEASAAISTSHPWTLIWTPTNPHTDTQGSEGMEQQHEEGNKPREAAVGTTFDTDLTKSRLEQEEEDIDLLDLLQNPTRGTPTDVEMCISAASLNGWSMQESKTCAAAALSGAINASRGRTRLDDHAVSPVQVMTIFREMWRTHIETKKAELMQDALANDETTTLRMRGLLSALEAGKLTKDEARAAASPGLKDKVEYIAKLITSLASMQGAKPSTASIGTQHLLYAVERFESSQAEVFLDQTKLIQRDLDTWWAALWRVVDDSSSGDGHQPSQGVFIYHMERHYALIFGLRQWLDAISSCRHREVLTCRQNQQPKAWICFDTELAPLLRESSKAGIILVRRREEQVKKSQEEEEARSR